MKKLLLLLCLLSGFACAQDRTIIQWQQAASTIFTGNKYVRVNCSTGMSCSYAGGTIVLTSTGGAGGSPGGTPNQIQWNSAGAFAGFTMSGDGTLVTSTGVLTITKINGITPGGTCTNQAVTVISTSGVPTCTTLSSAYVGTSIAVTGADINTSSQVTVTHLAAALPVSQGGWGLATLTAHALYAGNGTSAPTAIASPATNGNCIVGFNVTASAAVDPSCALSGVPVNAQSGNYSLLYSDRASYLKSSGGTTQTYTLPQVTGTTASNFPFVTQNLNSGNTTLTANAADKIDNGATGGSQTVLPNWAAYVYQDSSSAPGNWWTIRVPTFAAFGSTGALCSWSTSTGAFTCGDATGDVTTSASKVTTLASLNVNATAADYIAGGGTAQAQTATLSPALSANTTGVSLTFLPVAANTGAAPTLAVSGLTAKSITKCGTVALVANDLITTQQAEVQYDGTEWVLANPQAIACAPPSVTGTGYVTLSGGGTTAAGLHNAANATVVWAFTPDISIVSSTKLAYNVNTADNSASVYNLAIFNLAGNILCQTGAVAGTTLFPSAGMKTVSWSGGCGPLIAGTRYYFAMTGNAAIAILNGGSIASPVCGVAPATNSATTSAVWTTPITYNADVWAGCNSPQAAVLP